MAQPEFDWTFDDAPLEGEARPEAGGGPRPRRPGPAPPRRPRKPWPRWAWLALLGLALAGALGGWLFTRLGWLRLEAQIAAEVAYDDARARAREVDAVLAAQVTNDSFWRSQRTAEVRLGLPAPLPAGNLRPTAYPAEVVAVEALGGNVFAATVRRRYADSAGQVFSFDLVQRYLNVAPGAWRRLGTDLTGVVAATIVSAARLSATVPTNDLPWLRPALVAADEALVAACDAWQSCPAGYQLPVFFNAGADLLNPTAPLRAADPGAAAYPIIFDLAANPPGDPGHYRLSAPQVTGRPADAAAQAAYNRALSATLLGYLAGEVSRVPRSNNDYFLDALVARMEAQLGLSAPAAAVLSPLTFLPAEALWGLPQQRAGSVARAGLDDRWQVLELMNIVLDGQPPTVDGDLLRGVHRPAGLTFDAWLTTALGRGAAARAAAQWVTAAQRGLGRPTPEHDWPAAEGLALLCAGGLAVVAEGALRPLGPALEPADVFQVRVDRSGEPGRYLSANYFVLSGNESVVQRFELWVLDQTAGAAPVPLGGNAIAVGWGADGQLYYFDLGALDGSASSGPGLQLSRYNPVNGTVTPVLSEISFISDQAWSADRRSLLFTQAGDSAGIAPLVLMLSTPSAIRPLAENGYYPVFAPGSTAERGQVAFLRDIFGGEVRRLEVHVIDVATGADRLLFDSARAGGEDMSGSTRLMWSPGGAWLSFGGFGGQRFRLFTVEAASGQAREWTAPSGFPGDFLPVGFSADDRYLAAQTYSGFKYYGTYTLLDLTAAEGASARRLTGSSLAWAPAGHMLALSNPLGVFLVDAATGDYQWLRAEPCALDW